MHNGREAERPTDAIHEHRSDRELLESLGVQPLAEHTGERPLPWPLDILFYSLSASGLIHLLAVVLLAVGLAYGRRFAPGLLRPGGLLSLIPLLIALYFAWYLAECIHDSARGGVRAPNILTVNPGLSEVGSRVLYLVAEGILYILPAVLYPLYVQRFDGIFWVLAAWAIVLTPIGLLAMVILDSADALNPLFLLGSIVRVFVPYLGLLLLVAALAGFFGLVLRACCRSQASIWLQVTSVAIIAYGVFVLAHILGRFYWRYRDRLDWGL